SIIAGQLASVPAFDDAPNDDGVPALVPAPVARLHDDRAATTRAIATIDVNPLSAQVTPAVIACAKDDRPADTLHVRDYGVHRFLNRGSRRECRNGFLYAGGKLSSFDPLVQLHRTGRCGERGRERLETVFDEDEERVRIHRFKLYTDSKWLTMRSRWSTRAASPTIGREKRRRCLRFLTRKWRHAPQLTVPVRLALMTRCGSERGTSSTQRCARRTTVA
ncbi:MAG: hypothetical protein ACRELB_06915, partial [Polyangiaceae bacterium]